MHNLQLTEDQTLILDTVRKFVQDAVAPEALELDEHRRSMREHLAGLGELGLFGLPVPEDAGGAGMGVLPLAASCEEIGATSGSLARLLATQVQSALALAVAGNGPLDEVVGGAKLAAHLGAEHGLVTDGATITGKAELVPGAGDADVLVVVAHRDGAPVVCVVNAADVERTGLRSLGLASASPARVEFAGAAAELVAEGETAKAAILAAETAGWIAGAATAVGMGRASIQLAKKHASERIAFGKPLLAQQAVARKLLESTRAIDAARHLTWHAARLHDLGENATDAAIAARIAAVDAAVLAADEGIQIHGGFGYTVEYHVERHYRDAKTLGVLDGGNERLADRLAAAIA